MATEDEVQRLQRVYLSYRENKSLWAQWSGPDPVNRIMTLEMLKALRHMLQADGFFPLTDRRILGIGCGNGKELSRFRQWGALDSNLYGVDLLSFQIEEAKKKYPDMHFQLDNAEHLNSQNASFDLISLFTVFSSILDDQMARNVAAEVRRVLKPGGAVIWHDSRYNNPRNPNVRGVTKEMIRMLFPDFKLHLRTITLLPPLARQLGITRSVLYPILTTMPFLRSHYLGVLIKPQ